MAWFAKRRKGIAAAVAAILILFVDSATAKEIAAAVGAVLTYAVPNAG